MQGAIKLVVTAFVLLLVLMVVATILFPVQFSIHLNGANAQSATPTQDGQFCYRWTVGSNTSEICGSDPEIVMANVRTNMESQQTVQTPEATAVPNTPTQQNSDLDCDDAQTGATVNRPTQVPPILSGYLQSYANYINWQGGFTANQPNENGQISTVANILSYVQSQLADGSLIGQVVSLHFEWSSRATSRFGAANSSFKDVSWYGVVGTFEMSDWTMLESISIQDLGGFYVVVYNAGVTQQDVARTIMPNWISARAINCQMPQ